MLEILKGSCQLEAEAQLCTVICLNHRPRRDPPTSMGEINSPLVSPAASRWTNFLEKNPVGRQLFIWYSVMIAPQFCVVCGKPTHETESAD